MWKHRCFSGNCILVAMLRFGLYFYIAAQIAQVACRFISIVYWLGNLGDISSNKEILSNVSAHRQIYS